MTLETLSKENLNFNAPRFEVEVEGKKLDMSTSKEIINVTVSEKLDEGANFELTLHDGFDMNTQKFKLLDDSRFSFGNKITIKIGYGSNLHTMVMGKITSLEPSFFAGDTPTLRIRGQDPSYDYMKRASPERTFVDKTYSDIVRTIAQEAGLNCVVDNTGKFEKFIRKNNNETYYEFLDNIKNKVGFVFYIEGRKIHFVKPENNKKEILKLELGKDIISFNPVMNTTGLLAEVEVRGHNPQDPNSIFIGKAKAEREIMALANKTGSKDLAKKVVTDVVANSKEHAVAIAKAELAKANDTLLGGKVECIGLPQIRVGANVKLEKIGKLFSHKYYVTETTHTINERGYVTRFSVGHNNSIFDELGTTNKFAGKLNGVVCGIVTNNKDPDKQGRLKVKFPWLSDNNETDWVRITTFMAGGERGSFFLPEVGDEVLVAFENGNINSPYVIGALWNGVDKPPETNSDGKNNIRKIKSRSGHELIFNDEENKESLEIHTKAGHKITLDDSSGKEKIEIKDKSGNNSILVDSAKNAMAISSQMKIELKSGDNSILIDSSANSIAISSQLKLSIKAQSIEIEAGGMMTIKSSGVLTLQGSLIKIN